MSHSSDERLAAAPAFLKGFAQFRELNAQSFGKNITIFGLTVGQPMPMIAAQPK